ncbi:uncharacterized protein LOC116432787 [Nomia melanderi]|uniref:uncharacterized protein LOC116432787 n=1 Tax=Nomia melanderi TaxID=2448451 RepID=UPI003FCD1211
MASNIPQSTARVMNLTFLSVGVALNFSVILVIISKKSMRTATGLHYISLTLSNMVILIEPFEEVLKWFFAVDMKLNMDYVCMISFDVSVITIAILKLLLYIDIFQQHTSLGQLLLKKMTAMKGILLTWAACIVCLAIGLHIYDFFEGDMADIYVWNTIMFIIMPLFIYIALDCLILYELLILKETEGSWRLKELRQFVMLVIVAIAFLTIRTPYRVARAVNFIEPKASCCTDSKREILYFIAKTFPAVCSIIYIIMSSEFHEALKDLLKCRCQRSPKETV